MTHREAVVQALRKMNLFHEDGSVPTLDSLNLIDLVLLLEDLTSLKVPAASLRPENFESVETMVEMLDDLREG